MSILRAQNGLKVQGDGHTWSMKESQKMKMIRIYKNETNLSIFHGDVNRRHTEYQELHLQHQSHQC